MMLRLTCLVIITIAIGGCKALPYRPFDHAHESIPELVKPDKPIQVALVLGGGGARGMAHVGVLEELEKADIPVDLIVGCSAGGIVGALYADNPDAFHVKTTLMQRKRKDFIHTNIWKSRYCIFHRKPFICFMNDNLSVHEFEKLKIPLVVVAADLMTGELISFNSGHISAPVHASCAVPFCFSPVRYCGKLLVDGAVVDPVPVKVAQGFNPDIIIAVDIGPSLNNVPPTNLIQVATRSACIKHIAHSNRCLEGADIVIRPNVGHVGMFEENCNELLYNAGKTAASDAIPEIKRLLGVL